MNTQTQEALKMAIKALESANRSLKPDLGYYPYNEQINACKEALEQPAQESVAWISVKDRLPSTTQQIEVVFFANPYEWRTGLFTPKGFLREYENNVFQYHQHWGDDKYHTVDNVTHWMPLPEVPKEAV